MNEKCYTIGELSKFSGVSVRRIRFYSDKGLLPPATRTGGGYRLYSNVDAARLDLIRAFREIGFSLESIRKIFAKRQSLGEVLRARLEALEAEIESQRRIVATLRATLLIPEPTEIDLRRLWTMTSLSNTQFRKKLEQFFDTAAEGVPVDQSWKQQMIDAGTPELPEHPTAVQIDAWNEIMAIISDKSYIVEMRADIATMWSGSFDAAAYAKASSAILAKVRSAIAEGESPTSPVGRVIAQGWLDESAKAMQREPDGAFVKWHLEQYRKHHGRSARYQELMAIIRGSDARKQHEDEWRWINQAMTSLLDAA